MDALLHGVRSLWVWFFWLDGFGGCVFDDLMFVLFLFVVLFVWWVWVGFGFDFVFWVWVWFSCLYV